MGFEDYKGSIALGAGLKKAGTSDYPLMQVGDIQAEEGGKRLDVVLSEIKESSTSVTVNGTHQQSFDADTKFDKTDIADNLETEDSSKVLSAKQGVVLKNSILKAVSDATGVIEGAVAQAIDDANSYTDGEVGKKLDKTDVVDNLETENGNKALSAKQGVVLKDTILQAVTTAEGKISEAVTSANEYTDGKLEDKVSVYKEASTKAYFYYSRNGVQMLLEGNTNATGAHLVIRTSNGNIFVPETPTSDTHATSKKYVDSAIANATANIGGGTQLYKHSLSVFGGSTMWYEIIIINTSSDNLKDKRAESNFPDLLNGMVAISGRSMGSTQYTILGYIESSFYLSYTDIALIVYDENDSSERIKKISISSNEIQGDTVTLV